MNEDRARHSLDAAGADQDASRLGDAFCPQDADDPLGDEGAFPTTWQQLVCADASRD